jgi:calcineurin-like phosphoesterase family protein
MDIAEPPPGRIVVAGDWHGDTGWALHVIDNAARLLASEPVKIILHLGDFGIWGGTQGDRYRFKVSRTLARAGMKLLFVDGNHEDHTRLAGWDAARPEPDRRALAPVPIPPGPLAAPPRIFWLPRGHRWKWHGRTWLAAGGGVSLDNTRRVEGRNWWPEEEISNRQFDAIITPGHADVLVTHDCPSGVVHHFPDRPDWWDWKDIHRQELHARRLQSIVEITRPSWLMHGHLHMGYQRICDFGYGDVQVTGLDEGGTRYNYLALDTQAMEWELPS